MNRRDNLMDDPLLKTSEVAKLTFSRNTIDSKLKKGLFPQPDYVDPESKYRYWRLSTINNFFSKKAS